MLDDLRPVADRASTQGHQATDNSTRTGEDRDRPAISRLLAGFGALMIVLSMLAAVAILWQLRDRIVADAAGDSRRFAVILAAQTAASLKAVDLALEQTVGQLPAVEPETMHRELRSLVSSLPGLRNMFVIDNQGKSLHSARAFPPPPLMAADRSFFQAHRAGEPGPRVAPTVRNRLDGAWSLFLTRRVQQNDGSFGGLVAADIDPRALARFYATIDLGRSAGVVLVDRSGIMMARQPWLDAAIGQRIPLSAGSAHVLKEEAPGNFTIASPFDGIERLHGYAPVAGFPLVMVVFVDMAVVLERWWDDVFVAGAWVVGADLVIVVLMAVLLVQIRRRERSERRFREFAETASDWYWETDADLRFTYVSRARDDASAGGAEAAIGTSLRDALLNLPGDTTVQRFETDIAAQRPFRDFLCQVGTLSGRVRHLKISGRPRYEAGRYIGYRGAAHDITTEVEQRNASARANMRFLHAMETSNDGISFWDAEDRFVLCNDRYRNWAGKVGRALVPGITFEQFFWEGIRLGEVHTDPGKAADALAKRLAMRRAANGSPHRMMRIGRELLVRDHRLPDGGTLSIWTDITDASTAQAARESREASVRGAAGGR